MCNILLLFSILPFKEQISAVFHQYETGEASVAKNPKKLIHKMKEFEAAE